MPRVRRPLLALLVLVAALGIGYAVRAVNDGSSSPHPAASPSTPSSNTPSSSTPSSTAPALRAVALSALPQQVGQTLRLAENGGPFPYPHNDGAVFHNFEGHLPAEPSGFYREYTVPTPGSPDRGPRRLVIGRDGTVYYTPDHYGSFVIVEPGR